MLFHSFCVIFHFRHLLYRLFLVILWIKVLLSAPLSHNPQLILLVSL